MRKKIAILISTIMLLLCLTPMAMEKNTTLVNADTAYAAATSTADLSEYIRMDELYGWATVEAEGLNGTTGGGNTTPVTVTNLQELTNAASGNIPRVIIVSGRIECEGYGVLIGNNKTIIGADTNATIYGGIRIHNANNIIVSNINIEGTWPNSGPDDCVEIRNSHHIWINHLNIWNSTDGNLDITMGSDYITVSWCKFWYTADATDGVSPDHDHRLNGLISSGAGDHEATDMNKLHVTYHHNWFADRLDQRMPRVMYGRAHVYNNYYTCEGNNSCVGVDCYAAALVENNYYKKVNNPHHFYYPDNAYPSSIVARDNVYIDTTGKQESGQKRTESSVPLYETTVYDYFLNSGNDVPEIIEAYAGVQDMSDETKIPSKLSKGTLVKAVEEGEEPDKTPMPSEKPATVVNDNPITYDADTDTYTYHGSNSDGSNAFLEIDNPFAGKDFTEDVTYVGGKPSWTKGATIAYWVKVPENAKDAVTLNFNMTNHRQMERSDKAQYIMCQNYKASDATYSMGKQVTYVDANGKEFTVLKGYGKNVCYNPNYPTEGCYSATNSGGAHYAYLKGSDSSVASNWTYLNYIGAGMYEKYGKRFDEEGGENSRIQEAEVDGSLSLYASGTMGYRQDNWTARQINPNLPNYGSIVGTDLFNQFYYWGNGGEQTLSSGKKTPTMSEKGEWHYVVVVIQNDWIQYYMDGIEMSSEYLSWWGQNVNKNSAGESFNLGYGHKMAYRNSSPEPLCQQGMHILDFISNEDVVLTVGGLGHGATVLGQNTIGTPDGTQLKGLEYYYFPVTEKCILEDKIDLSLDTAQTPAPDKTEPPASQKPSEEPITEPSKEPVTEPSEEPSVESSEEPVIEPSEEPIIELSEEPSVNESANPQDSQNPENSEDAQGSDTPSANESANPQSSQEPNVGEDDTTFIPGDVDDNGTVELKDAQLALRAALLLDELDEKATKAGDVDENGTVELKDAQQILRKALLLIEEFEKAEK